MSKDYIERGALTAFLEANHDDKDWMVTQYNADWICSWIESQPAADVVEVKWMPVLGFEGLYEISTFGQVRNKKGEILKQRIKQSYGTCYKSIDLWKDGRYHKKYVHRLIAEAFIPNPDNLPFVNHKDEDGTNNLISNLEWCTREYNVNYGTAKERRIRKIRGIPRTEECKQKISASMKAYRDRERKEKGYCYNGRGAKMDGGAV